MQPRELRAWLLMQPRPKSLRIVAGDGQIHKYEIAHGVRWIEAATTVASLQPEAVEAFDEKQNLLRAIRPDDVDDPPEPRNAAIDQDPENARLMTFARLIAEAYKDSREFTAMAFDKLGELFASVVKKTESQERTIVAMDRAVQKLMLEKVADAAAGAADGEGPLTLDSLLQAMLQGKMQAEAERAMQKAVVTTNGAPSAKGGAKK